MAGVFGYTESIVSMMVHDNEVENQYLAYKSVEYSEDGESTVSFWDSKSHNELSEKEFDEIEECAYPGLQKMEMTWKWYKATGSQMADMSQKERKKLLKDLYDNFKINNAGDI